MVKILVTGDFVPCGRTENLVRQGDSEKLFGEFIPLLRQTDLNIVNLECPVVFSENAEGIKKNGPLLKTGREGAKILQKAGFNLVTLANNHFYDYGDIGVKDTLSVCYDLGIATVGGGINLAEASQVFFKQIKNKNFAFINVCEHEFSIATAGHGGANPLDLINNFYQIHEVRKKADYVVVIVHGGHEMYQLPNPNMQKTYRFLADAGADVVIGHHPHCYSGYEIYNQTPIFYSLGNFCFDENQRHSIWNEGYAVVLNFEDSRFSFDMFPYVQGDEAPGIRFMNDEERKGFEDRLEALNGIIHNANLLVDEFQKFCADRKKSVLSSFEPYSSRFLKALYVRHLLPSFLKEKVVLRLLNLIRCEAHRELVVQVLKNKVYNK